MGKLRVQEQLLEANLTYFDNFVDPREPLWDSEEFWIPMASEEAVPPNLDNRKHGEVLPIYLTWMGLKALRDQSRRLLAYNEFAINAVENRVSYIVGKGFGYQAVRRGEQARQSKDDPLCRQAMDVLDLFRDRNAWGEMEQEIVRRCDRDGEVFLRFFPQQDGICLVRVIEPEHIKPPLGDQDKRSFGVETDPQDVEDVKGYYVLEDPAGSPVFVPADEILHIKINVDRNAKRGLPTLVPVRKNLERAEKLLRNMSTVAQVQSSFALIRKHSNTSAAAVQTWQQGQADLGINMPLSGRTNYLQMLQPGRIVDAPASIDYEFPSASVDASGFVAILQAELRAVAARLVMPEYMLTADASNNNMASSLVAEAPAVKNFERLQAFYARHCGDGTYGGPIKSGVMWRVLRYAVEWGRLPEDVLTAIGLQVEGPSLVVRDKAKETARARQLWDSGILSRATWAKWEGVDYRQEQQLGAGGKSGTPLARDRMESLLESFTGVITDSLGRKQYYQDGKHIAGPSEDQKREIEAAGRHHLMPHEHGSKRGGATADRIARGEYTLGKGKSLDAAKGKAFVEKGGKLRVDSSAVKAVEYDPKQQPMTIHWGDGTKYQYQDVTAHEAEAFLHADSKGEWVNRNLKGVGYQEAAKSGRKDLSKPHPFEKVSGNPKTKARDASNDVTPIAGRTGRLNQNVAEGNQVMAAYALGKGFSNLPGNWPMDVQRFDGPHVAEGVECKTLLESKAGGVHMDKAAFARKEYWTQGYLLIPVRDYDQATHGKAYGDETLDAERGGMVSYKVVRDPLAHPDVFKGKGRPVHMCVIDHRDEWSKVLDGKGSPDERGWGRRQVYYGRGFGSCQIGGSGPPPLVCCDNPTAYRHLMSLPDAEVQRIAEQHQYGAKAYPSGADVPQRGKGLATRDAAQHHHTDMMRWKSKVIKAKVRLWNGVERQDRAEKRGKAIRQRLKALGTPTTRRDRERKQKLEFAANKADNAIKHAIPQSMDRARTYQQEYQTKLERGAKKWSNIERGLADDHPLKGVRF